MPGNVHSSGYMTVNRTKSSQCDNMTKSPQCAPTFLVLAVNILNPLNHLGQGKPGWLVALLQTLSSGNCHLDLIIHINVLITLLTAIPENNGHE